MIGVDFGTTNSCVAIAGVRGGVRAIPVATGKAPPFDTVLRSAVLDPEGERWWVGDEAEQRAETARGLRFLNSFKPFLDEHQLRERVMRRDVVGRRFDPVAKVDVADERWTSVWAGGEELFSRGELLRSTAAILGHLISEAIKEGGDPSEIWLGMPVSFSSCARKRLIAALQMAWDGDGRRLFTGYADVLRRVRFVLEPIAVAAGPVMRDVFDPQEREVVLVFDHGGGTLDLSVVEFGRHEGFRGLVPLRELAAGGSREVAGRSLDSALRRTLERRDDFRAAEGNLHKDRYLIDSLIERCKIALSVLDEAPSLPGVMVQRPELERAIAPVLDEIEALVLRTVATSGVAVDSIDRVVLTGGSSLVPAVQQRMRKLFSNLDAYHFLSYDPASRLDSEQAITDVALGLVSFAQEVAPQRMLEQVVLWDVELSIGGGTGMLPVARRGEPYEHDAAGQLRLHRRVEIPPTPGEGTSFGLYQRQLDHRYLFGIADVPPLPAGGVLEVELLPQQATPRLRVVDHEGRTLEREFRLGDWESETTVEADLQALAEDRELREYFQHDAEYLPARGFNHFECSPLIRRLRVGDLVEWARDTDGAGPGRSIERFRGTIQKILDRDPWEEVEEMSSLDLDRHRFWIADGQAKIRRIDGRAGSLRLAAKPGQDH